MATAAALGVGRRPRQEAGSCGAPAWRRECRLLALAVGLTLALGCADEDRTQTGFTPSLDQASTAGDDTTAALAPVTRLPPDTVPRTAEAGGLTISVLPFESGGPGVQVRLRPTAAGVSIASSLVGAPAGRTFDGAIRQGGCDARGSVVAWLVPVSADSLGSGMAASDVAVPLDSLTSRPHVVVYGRGGRPEACGAIPSGRSATVARPAPTRDTAP